jgi:hypothetical protein
MKSLGITLMSHAKAIGSGGADRKLPARGFGVNAVDALIRAMEWLITQEIIKNTE